MRDIIKKFFPHRLKVQIKKVLHFLHIIPVISGEYEIINVPNREQLKRDFSDTWKDESLPKEQMKITEKQLSGSGSVPHIDVLVQKIKGLKMNHPTLLEIGCSTGYHYEFFKKNDVDCAYEGCDYSAPFIEEAKKIYPNVPFSVDDATALTYRDKQFNIVISGCCILHIIDYEKAIMESSRVAQDYVIFHRTPIIHHTHTMFAKKIGYGKQMVEIFFNESELVGLFAEYGLLVESVETIDFFAVKGISEPVFVKEYVCKKVR